MLNLQPESFDIDSFLLILSQLTPYLIVVKFVESSRVGLCYRDISNEVLLVINFTLREVIVGSLVVDIHDHLPYEVNNFLLVRPGQLVKDYFEVASL